MNSFKMYLSRKYKNVPIKKVGLAQNKKKTFIHEPIKKKHLNIKKKTAIILK